MKFEKRIQRAIKSYEMANKKYGIATRLTISFPGKTPWLSKIAGKIITKQGGVLNIQFIDRRK